MKRLFVLIATVVVLTGCNTLAGFGKDVDRPVLQMQTPPRQQRGHGPLGSGACDHGSGHGATRAAVGYSPPSDIVWSSERMLSAWPPIAR